MTGGVRLPLRLARREVLRRPGRSALVALLVALPVAGMAMAVTLIRTDQLSLADEWTRYNGQADARFLDRQGMDGPDEAFVETDGVGTSGPAEAEGDLVDRLPALPDGSRYIAITSRYVPVRTEGGRRGDLELSDTPLTDPLTAGIHTLLEGRAPARPGEVALSPRIARRLGVDVGDTLTLARPELSFDVVGLAEQPGCLRCPTALVAPETMPDVTDRTRWPDRVLIDLPALSLEEALALQSRADGDLLVRGVHLAYGPAAEDRGDGIRWSLVLGGVALTVVGIVISAAFAVGARRQLVTLGQLSASGASPATVRASLVLQGTVTGVVGAVAGLAIAAVLLGVGHGWVEEMLDHRFDSYDPRVGELALVVLIGVAAATVAALIPARTAAGIPTLTALAGRRPLPPVPGRLVAGGLVGVALGLGLLFLAVLGSARDRDGDVWAFVAIAGGVLELLGACAIAPALVARLEPLAGRVRGSWRLAARGLARHRGRSGSVVSAVAAAGALAIAATALVNGSEARSNHESLRVPDDLVVAAQTVERQVPIPAAEGGGVNYLYESEPPATELAREIALILPDAEQIVARMARSPEATESEMWEATVESGEGFSSGYSFTDALVADPAVLESIRASAVLRDALKEDGVVLLEHADPGRVTIRTPDGQSLPGSVVGHGYSPGYITNLLITEDRARELGMVIRPGALLLHTPAPVTRTQSDLLHDLMDEHWELLDGAAGAQRFTHISWDDGESGPTTLQLELILTGVALVFALFVVGLSLALAAAESKDERDVLTVVGAPPGSLARSAGAKASLLAVIGGVLAIPVGFLPVIVFSRAYEGGFPLVFPGRPALLLLVGVSAIVGGVALLTSATAQRLRPVRVSTATFE